MAEIVMLYGDDGKGTVATSITVAVGQKFWFKGYAPNAGVRVDIWFDEYASYPDASGNYPFIASRWLATPFANQQRWFDTYPNDLCWILDTGSVDINRNKIYALYQSKLGKIWQGPIGTNLGFKATFNGQSPTGYVKVFVSAQAPPPPPPSQATNELRIYFIKLPWASEGLARNIVDRLAGAIAPIIQPLGYRLTGTRLNWSSSYFSFFFLKVATPAIGLAAIGLIAIGILIAAGLLLYTIAWIQQGVVVEQVVKTQGQIAEDAAKLLGEGKITREQYTEILTALGQIGGGTGTDGGGFFGIDLKQLMPLILVIGGIWLLGQLLGGGKGKK